MSSESYRAFIGYVFDTYVRPRIPGGAAHRLYGPIGSEFTYEFDRMRRTAQLTRFAQSFSEHDGDVYSTFRAERLRELVYDLSSRFVDLEVDRERPGG